MDNFTFSAKENKCSFYNNIAATPAKLWITIKPCCEHAQYGTKKNEKKEPKTTRYI